MKPLAVPCPINATIRPAAPAEASRIRPGGLARLLGFVARKPALQPAETMSGGLRADLGLAPYVFERPRRVAEHERMQAAMASRLASRCR